MKSFLLLLFFCFYFNSYGFSLTEAQKTDKLILYIENLKGATFIRNGSEYSASKAAEFLRMKRKKAGDDIKTARQFIKEVASKSSMSGLAYQIRLKDGHIYKSEELLTKELERIEKEN